MYQKDFILRMIEMLGELIAGLLGLLKKGDIQQAAKELDNAYSRFLKEEASYFRNIPFDELESELTENQEYSIHHIEIIAELFYVEAELRMAQNNEIEAVDFYKKSLKLHEIFEQESKTFSFEMQQKIAEIKGKIETLNQ